MALALFQCGAAGLAGNGIAGRVADREPMRSSVGAILILVAAGNLAATAHGSILLAALPLAIWSISPSIRFNS